ncbi:hypothetical protein K1T44_0666 [Listeria innocua]|nr:hypothetical protein K1T44_0666 [Listeria innocua]
MLLTIYIALVIICLLICLSLESKKQKWSKILFWLVFAVGVFFTIRIGDLFL